MTALFALSLLPICSAAQLSQLSSDASAASLITVLRGTVLNVDGSLASNIHVTLYTAGSALPVTSTYTESDGTFELYNIPAGDYELLAESADSRADDTVTVQSESASLNLRLQHDAPAAPELDSTVSVVQMMVPTSAQKLYRKALANVHNHKPGKALPLLDSALQIEPRFADALTLRGQIEMSNGKLAAAQDDLERAVKIDPAEANAYIELSVIYNHQGRFDDAMRSSERSLSLSPRSWQAYFEMAKATIAKGMYAQGPRVRAAGPAAERQQLCGRSSD